jgi:uncharacterized membrane protein
MPCAPNPTYGMLLIFERGWFFHSLSPLPMKVQVGVMTAAARPTRDAECRQMHSHAERGNERDCRAPHGFHGNLQVRDVP